MKFMFTSFFLFLSLAAFSQTYETVKAQLSHQISENETPIIENPQAAILLKFKTKTHDFLNLTEATVDKYEKWIFGNSWQNSSDLDSPKFIYYKQNGFFQITENGIKKNKPVLYYLAKSKSNNNYIHIFLVYQGVKYDMVFTLIES